MSKKTELIKVFKDYKTQHNNFQAEKNAINNNLAYTLEGKDLAIKELIKKYNPVIQSFQSKAVQLINDGADELNATWKNKSVGRLVESGYQAGLANVIKMLEIGVIQEKEELQFIIDTYADDFNALSMIKKMTNNAANHKNEKLKSVVYPTDNRVENRELLEQLRGNVEKYISVDTVKYVSKQWNTFNQNVVDVSSCMDSMAEFVETRLGDDLQLLN